MKKRLTFLILALVAVAAVSSCSYDDRDLWGAVEDLNGRVDALEEAVENANNDIATLRKLVEAIQENLTISSVVENENGYTIYFSDGTSATITNGTDAPAISIIQGPDGLYYWALDGEIIEVDGRQIKAEGTDGVTPELRINGQTKEWEISMDGGLTWTSLGIVAEGQDGQDGDSMFSEIQDNETEVVFILSDGTTIVIPKSLASDFAIVFTEDRPLGVTEVDEYYLFAFGDTKDIQYTGAVKSVDVMNVPQGWSAQINSSEKTVSVTAPVFSGTYYSEGILSLVAIDSLGETRLASIRVVAADFSDPEGTFVLNEGNMTSENGTVVYITSDGHVIDYAYWRMNGTELGNVAQDMFIDRANDKLYIVTQNGGNDGFLVEAEASTLKKINGYQDELSSLSWPTHVAVVNNIAYIRDNRGVSSFDLNSKTLTQMDGGSGALKNRMAVVDGKIFVPASRKILVISGGAITSTIELSGTVTGVIKADEEGYLWVSCSTSPATIIKLNANDYSMTTHELEVGGVSPGWGATPGITAKGDDIYFTNNTSTIYRHNFTTGTTETLGDVKSNVANWGIIYNMPAVHPVTGEYYYNTILGYGWSFLTNDISVYNVSGGTPTMIADYQNYTHFPAGFFFTEAF